MSSKQSAKAFEVLLRPPVRRWQVINGAITLAEIGKGPLVIVDHRYETAATLTETMHR